MRTLHWTTRLAERGGIPPRQHTRHDRFDWVTLTYLCEKSNDDPGLEIVSPRPDVSPLLPSEQRVQGAT